MRVNKLSVWINEKRWKNHFRISHRNKKSRTFNEVGLTNSSREKSAKIQNFRSRWDVAGKASQDTQFERPVPHDLTSEHLGLKNLGRWIFSNFSYCNNFGNQVQRWRYERQVSSTCRSVEFKKYMIFTNSSPTARTLCMKSGEGHLDLEMVLRTVQLQKSPNLNFDINYTFYQILRINLSLSFQLCFLYVNFKSTVSLFFAFWLWFSMFKVSISVWYLADLRFTRVSYKTQIGTGVPYQHDLDSYKITELG